MAEPTTVEVTSPADERAALGPMELQAIDVEDGTFTGIAIAFNSPIEAFVPTVIDPKAVRGTLRRDKSRVKILRDHRAVIGKPTKLSADDKALTVEGKISQTPLGVETLTLMRDGALTDLSIGFEALEFKVERDSTFPWLDGKPLNDDLRRITKLRLFEVSVVAFGANPAAKITEVNAVVPFQNLPLADVGRRWSGAEARRRIRAWSGSDDEPNERFRRGFLWFDSARKDEFGAYKLPIADVISGRLTAVPRGIFAAAAAVSGGRTPLDVPDSDLPRIRNHLARYYRLLGRTPPWERNAQELAVRIEPLLSLTEETPPGDALSAIDEAEDAIAEFARAWTADVLPTLTDGDAETPSVDGQDESSGNDADGDGDEQAGVDIVFEPDPALLERLVTIDEPAPASAEAPAEKHEEDPEAVAVTEDAPATTGAGGGGEGEQGGSDPALAALADAALRDAELVEAELAMAASVCGPTNGGG